jgi:outer membrane protein TolC
MRIRWVIGFMVLMITLQGSAWAQEQKEPLTLEESIKIVLDRSLIIHSAVEGVAGSEFRRKAALTDFFPKWDGSYSYSRVSPAAKLTGTAGGIVSISAKDNYNFNTVVSQPLFHGGSILANYRLEKMGVDLSKMDLETVKRDIVLQVREEYYNILRAEKFLDVAKQAVKNFEAQLEVAKAFFDVGLIPKNDLLQSEVRLANARQSLVRAESDLALAKSSFNILLRRDVNTPFQIVDILEFKPSPYFFEESLSEALRQRPEIKAANIQVNQAKETVKIARAGFFPTIDFAASYNRLSDEYDLSGGLASERRAATGLATMTFWEWGKTAYRVGESKVRVNQAEDAKDQLIEVIILEVKQNYLNVLQSEKNVGVAEKSIEQAEENLRLNEERYKYQVATATDVLDAVTLLAQARVNYYGALSEFNIAKARLERSMGRMYP